MADLERAEFGLHEVLREVNGWCDRHHLTPGVAQAGEKMTERTFRYYRTIGLLDAPSANSRYTSRHLLQLKAIRGLQAQSLGLPKIRSLLFGKSDEELRSVTQRVLDWLEGSRLAPPLPASENWIVASLNNEFLLLSRSGRMPNPSQLEKIRTVLATKPIED